jgi:hypothetical protein
VGSVRGIGRCDRLRGIMWTYVMCQCTMECVCKFVIPYALINERMRNWSLLSFEYGLVMCVLMCTLIIVN